jgi:hypothetical protein
MSLFFYKDQPLAEPGNVQFGNHDISEIGDGTVTGAIVELNAKAGIKKKEFSGVTDATYGTINLPSDIPIDGILNVYMHDNSRYYNASLRGVGNILVWNYDTDSGKVVPVKNEMVYVTILYIDKEENENV